MSRSTTAPALPYAQLFWDLDGTITDSYDGIVRSVMFALQQLGRKVEETTLDRFAGPPLVRSFQMFYGLEGEELARAVDLYRDRYLRVGWQESHLVPGVGRLLRDLHRTGVPMSVATVKPRSTAERILDHFRILRCFDAVHGPAAYGLAVDKTDVLGEALGGGAWQGPGRAAMIGDHEEDMRAAKTFGVDGIAVLYGYGDRQALLAAKPAAIAADAGDLRRLLLGGAHPSTPALP